MMKENYKEIYKFYKSHKICPWCKSRKAYKDKVKCLVCLMDDRFQAKTRRAKKKVKYNNQKMEDD